jgi:TolA-binding protein
LTIGEWVAVAIAIAGALTAGYSAWSQRDVTVSEAWSNLLKPLRERITELDGQVKLCNDAVEEMQKQVLKRDEQIKKLQQSQQAHEEGIRRLAAQVVSLGGKPVYTLPDEVKP